MGDLETTHRAFKTLLITTLVWIFIASAAHAQNFREGHSFWNPPKNTSQCRSSYKYIEPFELTVTLVRQKPWENDDGPHFAVHYGMMLADTIAGRSVNSHKKLILKVAAANTYTKSVIESGDSPIYVQSILLRTTAMYITVLQSRGLLAPAERKILVDWGNKMISGQKGTRGNRSADSQMISGVAMMSWGSVTNDTRLMKTGYKKFMGGYKFVPQSVGKLRRHPGLGGATADALSLEDEYNIALSHAVEGVAILRNLGVDISNKEYKGKNLHDAVAWWADVMQAAPSQFKGNKAWGFGYHIGWIPIYRHMFPQSPSMSKLNARARKVTSGKSPTFRAGSLSGATDCLW